jgi:hypothetical protein
MKGEFRSRESKKDRQFNGQKKNDKNRNNDLHSSTQNIKDLETLLIMLNIAEILFFCSSTINQPMRSTLMCQPPV